MPMSSLNICIYILNYTKNIFFQYEVNNFICQIIIQDKLTTITTKTVNILINRGKTYD
jgi:hypothetical protein